MKQSYGPEGCKFYVLAGELRWEPMSGNKGESILVTLMNIPLASFGNVIPDIEASIIDVIRGKIRIASVHITEHHDGIKSGLSYRANVAFYISIAESGKSVSFYLDNQLLYIGMPREHRWTLVGNMLQLNCQEMMI